MKRKLQINALLFKMIFLFTCFMLTILYNQVKAAEVPADLHNRNLVELNFKQDKKKDELTIKAKSAWEGNVQFFIFSPDGFLINEISVCLNKITTIKGLKKGLYLYECFDNDNRMKSGSLMIK